MNSDSFRMIDIDNMQNHSFTSNTRKQSIAYVNEKIEQWHIAKYLEGMDRSPSFGSSPRLQDTRTLKIH